MKFRDYIVKWKDNARLNIGDGWKKCQDQIIRDHISIHLDSLNIREITPDHISNVLKASVKNGHSKKQQLKIYNVLSKIFSDAIHFFELIEKSPVRKRFHRPITHDLERPSLTPEQSFIVLEYVMHHPLYGSAVWLQLLTGVRVSEVHGLEWDDIEWSRNAINVKRAFNKHTKKFQSYTKNKNHYQVPMTPKLKQYLQEHRNQSRFICANPGGGMLASKSYDEFLKRLQLALKLPIGSSHGLRHSCARLYASLGASDEDLQKLLGHKHLSSTKTYIHITPEALFKIAKKIA